MAYCEVKGGESKGVLSSRGTHVGDANVGF